MSTPKWITNFGELKQLEPTEITNLIGAARKGDISARDKLIVLTLKHANYLATSIERRFNCRNKELQSAAPYFLVKCINSFLKNAQHDNIHGYITTTLYHNLKNHYLSEKLIRVPASSLHKTLKNGTYDVLNVVGTETDTEQLLGVLVKHLGPKIQLKLTVNTDSTLDVWETINSVLEDDEECRILELKIVGCSDKEIAIELGRSNSYIATKRTKILHAIKMELLK